MRLDLSRRRAQYAGSIPAASIPHMLVPRSAEPSRFGVVCSRRCPPMEPDGNSGFLFASVEDKGALRPPCQRNVGTRLTQREPNLAF